MQAGEPMHIFSVSGLTLEIKELLEMSLPSVWVEGEVSNFTHHSSGHLYFSLKDENAQIACVMWKQRAAFLSVTPRDGMKIRAFGSVRVYEKRGTYQLDVLRLVPAGVGELQSAFEALKQRLNAEGLFDARYKKPLPRFPKTIGIVSSAGGAAVRDIVTILNRRAPYVKKILRPTLVQGEGAAADIAAAIQEFNDYGAVDLIILARGGGSIEDLWAFNEEIVVRAIFASVIPIISAVGHEIDFTIADFVADLRAPTPSAAAELAVPDSTELLQQFTIPFDRAKSACRRLLQERERTLTFLSGRYAFRRPLDQVLQHYQRLDELSRSLEYFAGQKLTRGNESLEHLGKRLCALHPEAVLRRGFTLVRNCETGRFVTACNEVDIQHPIEIFLHSGSLSASVTAKDEGKRLYFSDGPLR